LSANLYKKEFYNFVKILRSEGFSVLTKIKTKSTKIDGLVNFTNPIQIIIFLNRNPQNKYKYALLTLLHECGHIIDEKRYKNSKRLKIYHKLINYKKANYIRYCTKKEKKLFLYTEYLADFHGKKLIKKYKLKIDPREMEEEQALLYYVLYNEIVLKKVTSEEYYNKFIEFVKKTNFLLTKKDIDNFGDLNVVINNTN